VTMSHSDSCAIHRMAMDGRPRSADAAPDLYADVKGARGVSALTAATRWRLEYTTQKMRPGPSLTHAQGRTDRFLDTLALQFTRR
jgi:hypothetical protein